MAAPNHPGDIRLPSTFVPSELATQLDARTVSYRAFRDTRPVPNGCAWLTGDPSCPPARDEVLWTDANGIDFHAYACRAHLLDVVDHALAAGIDPASEVCVYVAVPADEENVAVAA